ncbi:MAG: DNA-binding response regulator, partial [Thiobacillus sp.]|nr:DNA-binding response regulator [Thiobacillus sp.]
MIPERTTKGGHILAVDDDEGLLRLLALRLRAWGFRVTTA